MTGGTEHVISFTAREKVEFVEGTLEARAVCQNLMHGPASPG